MTLNSFDIPARKIPDEVIWANFGDKRITNIPLRERMVVQLRATWASWSKLSCSICRKRIGYNVTVVSDEDDEMLTHQTCLNSQKVAQEGKAK